MKKKIIGILVVMLMIGTAYSTIGETFSDQSDQQQTIDEMDTWVSDVCLQAQSFVPTLRVLTRIELKLRRYFNPVEDITVSIRTDLDGDDLTSISKSPSEIPSSGSDPLWITFDFDDIRVTPGNLYFIVCSSEEKGAAYYWRRCDSDVYPHGDAWNYGYYGDYWCAHEPPFDLCFTTYGTKGKAKLDYENQFFLQFLENHPHLFPLIRQILGLNI